MTALFRALIAACLLLTLARLVAAAPTPTLGDLTGISGSASSYLTTTEAFDQCDGSQLLFSMTSYVGYCETTTVGGQIVSIQQQLNSNSTMIWSTYTGSWLGTNCNGAANGPIAAGGLAPLMLFGDKYLPKCHVAEGFASSVKINPAPPSMIGATMRVYFDKGCTQQLMLTYLEPGGKCLSKGGSKESSSTTPFNSTHLQMRSWVNSTSCSGKAVETRFVELRSCYKGSSTTSFLAPEDMYYSLSWTTAAPSGLTPGQIAAIVSCVVLSVAAAAGAAYYYVNVFRPRQLAAAAAAIQDGGGGGGGLAAQDENAAKGKDLDLGLRASSGAGAATLGGGEEEPRSKRLPPHTDPIPNPAPAPANQQV